MLPKKWAVAIIAAALAACAPHAALAQKISDLPAATTLTGTEKVPAIQGAGCATHVAPCSNVALTVAQLATLANTTTQPLDADLTSLAGQSTAANKCQYWSGAAAAALFDCTGYIRGLGARADAAAARSYLGLGSIATQAASGVAITGGTITGVPGLFYESSYAATGTPTGFLNATIKSARTEIASASTVDLYTVPSGKKAIVPIATLSNTTASTSINYQLRAKIGGTYYPLTASVALAGQTLTAVNAMTLVLEAGESLAITTDAGGITLFPQIVEFDAASLWKSARLLSIASGDNVLYTVPSGKAAYVQNATFGARTVTAVAYVANSSGTAITATLYGTASGVTTSSSTARTASSSVASAAVTAIGIPPLLGSGESVVLNSSAAVSGGWAWVTYQAAP